MLSGNDDTAGAGQLAPASFAGFQKAEIKLKPNFDPADMLANIDYARSLGLPEIWCAAKEARKERLLIVGNGPSVQLMLGRLKRLAHRKSTRILAVNGAHHWLRSKGIKPWAHLMMDASAIMARHVPDASGTTTYLLASQCHPDVFEAVKGRDVWLWHAFQGLGEYDHLRRNEYNGMLVCGGCTAALRAINLGFLMGFRNFEMYGVDSCFWGDDHHANEYGEAGAATLKMRVGDRVFDTAGDMAKQAQDFQSLIDRWGTLFPGAKISVHGDGVIVEMMRQRNAMIQERKSA